MYSLSSDKGTLRHDCLDSCSVPVTKIWLTLHHVFTIVKQLHQDPEYNASACCMSYADLVFWMQCLLVNPQHRQ